MEAPTIYLAGPVGHAPDASEWREKVTDYYSDHYEFRNPLDRFDVPAEDLDVVDGTSNPDNPGTVGVDEIVETDKQLLDESDGVLLGYKRVISIGSPMEVMWARERDLPVALWIRDDTKFDELSPWYRYHATALTTDLGMALRHIEDEVTGDA